MVRRYLAAVFFLVIALWAGAAAADEADKAAAAFKQGVERFKKGDHGAALAAFEEANRLRPSWKLLFNIGQCQAALKRYGPAMESFERYLAEGGDEVAPERRDDVLAELDRLSRMVGGLEIRAQDGTNVVVQGDLRGVTPLSAPVRITAGLEQEVALVRDGETLLVKKVVVGGGQVAVVEVPSAGAGQKEENAPQPTKEDRSGPPSQEKKGLSPVYFWVGLGATVVLGGATLALGLVTDDRYNELKDDPGNEPLRDEGKTLQATGLAFLGLTAAAAVTTGVLAFFTEFGDGEKQAEPSPVSLAPCVSPLGFGLTVRGEI